MKIENINVYRWCLDCGYEQFEPEMTKVDESGRRTSNGFIDCPKCKGRQFALGGYHDRRKSGDEQKEQGVSALENEEQLYAQAVEVVRKTQRASLTHLQRRMGIEYATAARLVNMLEERGVIGPAQQHAPREILQG